MSNRIPDTGAVSNGTIAISGAVRSMIIPILLPRDRKKRSYYFATRTVHIIIAAVSGGAENGGYRSNFPGARLQVPAVVENCCTEESRVDTEKL